jgi:hypothetical protein
MESLPLAIAKDKIISVVATSTNEARITILPGHGKNSIYLIPQSYNEVIAFLERECGSGKCQCGK